jgi:hypothetical protein
MSIGPVIESKGLAAEEIRDRAKDWIEREAAKLHAR